MSDWTTIERQGTAGTGYSGTIDEWDGSYRVTVLRGWGIVQEATFTGELAEMFARLHLQAVLETMNA
jgi:hypothetical protein